MFFMGMFGLDKRIPHICAKWSTPTASLIRWKNIIANNFVATAKKLVSPYFGANDFAFAYANA